MGELITSAEGFIREGEKKKKKGKKSTSHLVRGQLRSNRRTGNQMGFIWESLVSVRTNKI